MNSCNITVHYGFCAGCAGSLYRLWNICSECSEKLDDNGDCTNEECDCW
jgi:hypothetical protein